MVVTSNLLAQWAALGLTALLFLHRQTKIAGSNQEKLADMKDDLNRIESLLLDRIAKLEKRTYREGDMGFLTTGDHDKGCNSVQRLVEERIGQNALMFERSTLTMEKIADRMDKMDEARESQREQYDVRLRRIERGIDKLDSTVTSLATIIDRRSDDT